MRRVDLFAAKPGVELTVRRFDMVPTVLGDADRIHQVLFNLLGNAAKFTDAGEVGVDLYLDVDDKVHICVEDSGPGIKECFLGHIFDKFHQAYQGDTLTQKPGGTGLGLAICRELSSITGAGSGLNPRSGRGHPYMCCCR